MHATAVESETWAVVGGRAEPSAGTPTWEAFEELIGGLEGGPAVACASGMGAVAAIVDPLPVGGTVVLPDDRLVSVP